MPSALFIEGGWEGHQPRETAELVSEQVSMRGVRVEHSDALTVLDAPDRLRSFEVIVPCWTMGELSPEREAAITGAVEGGVGLAGWHGGMGDAFRASTHYQFMVGGQFVAHPGDIIDYRVRITDRGHPITRGIEDFDVRSEQYYMHTDPSNRVLAETEFDGSHAPWIAGCMMPVVWTRLHGRGRIAYCSIGHTTEDLSREPVLEIATRCILWAAGVLDEQ